ncbi:ubiquitin-protein ligase [Lithospermum erythrorhizon]|uniref:RING-type E3 ubiquitin transferase n=1 Tax=Lithospermum erythrorhizon TaxID=34254 RepID=A0AAV3NZW1_LITER
MSSVVGGGGGAASQQYFCYQCERTVTITTPSSDLVCPNCQGGFLEEYEPPSNPTPPPIPDPFFSDFGGATTIGGGAGGPGLPFIFSSSGGGSGGVFGGGGSGGGGGGGGGEIDLLSLFGGGMDNQGSNSNPNAFNPFAFLNHYFNNMRAGGANIQLVFEGPGGGGVGSFGGGGGGLPSNFGDYFFGPGLEQLIQQLAENDPNRYGTPPASKSAIDGLPDIKITEDLLASDSYQCAVCKDSFELSEVAKQIPCKHIYHKDCILPWLELHNSCPVCRFELPTDDPDYENRRNGQQQNANQSSNSVATNAGDNMGSGTPGIGTITGNSQPMPRTVERRVTISFPQWLLSEGLSAEASNSGAGAVGGNRNDGGSSGSDGNNTGGRGQRDSGSGEGQARQEDLD